MRTLFPLAVVLLVLLALPGVAVFVADLLGYGPNVNAYLESRFGLSHRLALGIPAASALFAVPPILILLYFLRLRRKPIPVPSTFLWKKSIEDLHVNRLLQWLRRNVLLLLQLLAILAMIYGVLGPRLHGSLVGGRHYILIIDNSASMNATDSDPNRLAWAKAEALKEIDAATDADFGMVIAFHDAAEIRQSYTSNRAALKRAVEAIEPTVRQTRLDEALSLAASLANPERATQDVAAAPSNPEPGKERTYFAVEGMQADVHLYSDGKFPPVADFALANLNLTYHVPPVMPDGGASNNLAVTRLDAERDSEDPARVICRAMVRNYRAAPANPKVRLEVQDSGGRLIASYEEDRRRGESDAERTARTTLPARGERPDLVFTLPDVPDNTDLVLNLKIDGAKDALPADDQGWVVLGIVRKAKVLVVGARNPRLRDAFDSPAMKRLAEFTYLGAEVLTDADPKPYLTPAREGQFDLVVFDRCAPPSVDAMPAANTFFIGFPPPPYLPADQAAPGVTTAVSPVVGPTVRGWDSKHPVMRYLRALDEIDVADGFSFPDLPPRTQRLIEGDRNLVLLAAIPRKSFTDLAMTFPLMAADGRWNTNWPLKPSFPLFLLNVLRYLGNVRDAGAEDVTRPGQVKLLRASGAGTVRITKPDGSTVKLERGSRADFAVAATDQLGVYTAKWDDPSGSSGVRRFAVNLFDPMESDIAPTETVTVGSQTVSADQPRKAPMDLWKIPVLIGFLVLLAEWWIYNKRVQI